MCFFSIIVPVYNIEKYIAKCIDSVLSQTYHNFELILVDDGSTDSSGLICDDYKAKDSRIKVIHKSNGGLVSARKAGAVIASGDYVICVDGDDWIAEDYLEEAASIIKQHNPDIISFSYYSALPTQNRPIVTDDNWHDNRTSVYSEIFPKLIYPKDGKKLSNSLTFKVFRRELYVANQIRVDDRIKIGEDSACFVPCVAECSSLFTSSKCVYYYRQNNSSMTKSRKPFSWDGPKLIYEHFKTCLADNPFPFEEQICRRTVHAFFNVAVSQFYRKEPYWNIVKQIKAELDCDIFKDSINNCKFSGSAKVMIIDILMRHKLYFLMYIYSKLK